MLTPSLSIHLTIEAQIAVNPPTDPTTGKRGEPEPLFPVLIAPLDVVDPHLAESLHIEAPLQYKQTFIYVKESVYNGMFLFVNGKQYPIKGVASYPDEDDYTFYYLILEDIKVK